MRDRHALGIGGRAGGEDDLGRALRLVASGSGSGSGVSRFRGFRGSSRPEPSRLARASTPARRSSAGTSTSSPTSIAFALTIVGDAREQIRRRAEVDRHEDDAREQAAPERDDPFGAVLRPDDDLVVRGRCRSASQARRKRARRVGHLPVGHLPDAIAVVVDEEGSSRGRSPRRSRGGCRGASGKNDTNRHVRRTP